MLNLIDRLLNRITMYRLVFYVLLAYLAIACVFGVFHILSYNPLAIVFSTAVITLACWVANGILAKLFHAQTNTESFYITAWILASIITPVMPTNFSGIAFLVWASIFAMASKYILSIGKKHIFNPSAIAVVLTAFIFHQYASWWICGNMPMLAFIVIGGLLIIRKIQRFDLVLSFLVAAAASIFTTMSFSLTTAEKALTHTPLLFFASIMITEPLTTPPTRPLRVLYGVFVGLLFAPAVHVGAIGSTPELALVVGNIFSYLLSPKWKRVLKLKEKREVGTDIYEFAFAGKGNLAFTPGQYLEWTLGHNNTDLRGNRRYFTIASSPTEKHLRLGVKFYDQPSSYKKRMVNMEPGDEIVADGLAGDFIMPRDVRKKLVFIAGGIGVTPFRSMIKYLSDVGERRDIVLLYSNRTVAEIAYRDVFDAAERTIGLRTVYAVTGASENPAPGTGVKGRIDADMLKKKIPDYTERMFYISGTHAMVTAFKKTLRDMDIPRSQIKSDFFPGFV